MKQNEHPWTDKQKGPYLDRGKVANLYEKFRKLAAKEFGTDCDGDLPIDITIIDRTRYERLHFRPVPYDGKADTPSEHDDVLRSLMTNLAIASESLNRWYRCLDHNPRPHTATDDNLASENRQLVERNLTIENELRTMRKEHAVQIRQDEAVKSARAKRNAMETALHHLWTCDVVDCEECETHKQRHRLTGNGRPKKTRKKA